MQYDRYSRVSEGDVIELGEDTVDIQVYQYGKIRAVTTGERREYLLNQVKLDDAHTDFELPDGARWFGVHRNDSTAAHHVWFGIPVTQFEGVEVDQ